MGRIPEQDTGSLSLCGIIFQTFLTFKLIVGLANLGGTSGLSCGCGVEKKPNFWFAGCAGCGG